MSEDVYSQFLRFTVDESAASTMTEGTAISTGASISRIGDSPVGLEVHAISCTLSMPEDLPSTGTSEFIDFCISTRSGLTSMPTVYEDHVIYRNRYELSAGVGTYLPLVLDPNRFMPHWMQFIKPLLISHSKLYPYVKSSNSSAAGWARGFFLFNYVLLDQGLALEALEAFAR